MNYLFLFASPILHFILLLPLMFLVRGNYRSRDLLTFFYILLVLIAESVIAERLDLPFFPGQQWNWIGKGACFVIALLVIISGKPIAKARAGWTTHLDKSFYKVLVPVSIILLLMRFMLKVYFNQFHKFDFETILFQATMPGLSEELIYRGLLLGLFNKLYSATYIKKRMWVSWPAVWVSILFALAHGFRLDEGMHLHFSFQSLCMTFAVGLVLAWLRQRSGSLWPSIVFHNLWNLIVLS